MPCCAVQVAGADSGALTQLLARYAAHEGLAGGGDDVPHIDTAGFGPLDFDHFEYHGHGHHDGHGHGHGHGGGGGEYGDDEDDMGAFQGFMEGYGPPAGFGPAAGYGYMDEDY